MNIITAAINSFGKSVTCPLYQWDYGQILMITGITLPDAYEVNFAQGSETCTVIGTADGVEIPDEYLQNASDIIAYLYLHTGETDGETVYELTIPVIARPEPSDIEPTPVQQDVITQAIAALNTAVNEAEGYAQDAQEAAESIPEHVLVYDEQTLTDAEKAQARANIGASDTVINNLKDGSYNQSLRQSSAAQEGSSYTMGGYASAFGSGTKASGGASHAEGYDTTASNTASHSEGRDTVASGVGSHAEGWRSVASASQAHAEGRDTVASGTISHAEGEGTIANHRAQTVAGQFNIADPASGAETARGTYVEIIGNGVDANTRSNARTLDWDGNETLSGKLTVGAWATDPNDVPTLLQVQGLIPSQTDAVKYTAQTLTDAQKAQARTNIDVPSQSDFDTVADNAYEALGKADWAVSYNPVQSLTDQEKADARANIDAVSSSDINAAILASLITDTASGDPCAITDGANAPVVDCKVAIVPKQEGSGTPSPTNVRPISGWTEMTLTQTGKNLVDPNCTLFRRYQRDNGGGSYSWVYSSDSASIAIPVKPNKAYTLSHYLTNQNIYRLGCIHTELPTEESTEAVEMYNVVRETTASAFGTTKRTYTTDNDATYLIIQFAGDTMRDFVVHGQVELGSTATAYEPYKGTQTYTQSWTPTVYGGELDLTTGLLTVTYGMVDLGTLNWGVSNAEYKIYRATPVPSMASNATANERKTGFVCSHYPPSVQYTINANMSDKSALRDAGTIFIRDTDYTDATAFKTAMSGVMLAYELAEPTTIQLTPTEVSTILGSNTFSADTGAVSLEYRCDTKLYIAKVL